MELNNLQKLAVAQALLKVVKEQTDPHGGKRGESNLRTEADDDLRAMYESTGVDRVRISIGGEAVGTMSARLSKPVERVEPEVFDSAAFVKWLRTSDGGLDTLHRLVAGMPDKVLAAATADGELPDGCRMVARSEPAKWTGTMLRVDAAKVASALAGELPQAVAGLLAGEVE